jgi:hypothetical protein
MLELLHEKEVKLAEIKKHLAAYFSERPEVAAVYLFGSFPLLKDTPSSDIDLAILTSPLSPAQIYQLRKRYYVDLSRTLGREIDIVLLKEAGELLTFQILKYGRLILEKDPAYHRAFRGKRLVDCLDFKYHESIMQEGMIRAMRKGCHG